MKRSIHHKVMALACVLLAVLFCTGCLSSAKKAAPTLYAQASDQESTATDAGSRVSGSVQSAQNSPQVPKSESPVAQSPDDAELSDDSSNPNLLDEDVDPDLLDEDMDFLDDEGPTASVTGADPLEKYNRFMFGFNDSFYIKVAKPVEEGYKKVVPSPVRSGVRNFFRNLMAPMRFIASALQGKGRNAQGELSRFMINTTLGVGGFMDLTEDDPRYQSITREDMGQVLGTWGFGEGFFWICPIAGPLTVRSTFGWIGDIFLDPVTYVDPWYLGYSIDAYEYLNEYSYRLDDYITLQEAALDPYEMIRDAYLQNRRKQLQE